MALITSIAGVVGAGIGISLKGRPSTSSASSTAHFISIEGVNYSGACINCAIRVVADVNGQAYSYPGRAVWADLGSNMSKEKFPVVSSSEFAVSFTAFFENPDGDIQQLQSQAVNRDSLAALPVEREYRLRPFNSNTGHKGSASSVKGSALEVMIQYRIE